MISFLEGVQKDLPQYLHNPPFVQTVVIPRVPATTTTEEVPEQIKPKKKEIRFYSCRFRRGKGSKRVKGKNR